MSLVFITLILSLPLSIICMEQQYSTFRIAAIPYRQILATIPESDSLSMEEKNTLSLEMASLEQAFDQSSEQFKLRLAQITNRNNHAEIDYRQFYSHLFKNLYDTKRTAYLAELKAFNSAVNRKARNSTLAINMAALIVSVGCCLAGLAVDPTTMPISSTDLILAGIFTGGGTGAGSTVCYIGKLPHLIISSLTMPNTLQKNFDNLQLLSQECAQFSDTPITINDQGN